MKQLKDWQQRPAVSFKNASDQDDSNMDAEKADRPSQLSNRHSAVALPVNPTTSPQPTNPRRSVFWQDVAPGRSRTVHEVILVVATEPGRGNCMSFGLMFLSLLVVYVQFLLMYFIAREGSHPKCSRNGECLEGMFCGPNFASQTMRAVQCHDCGRLSWNGERPHEEWWIDGLAYCNATDLFPGRCDFVVHNAKRMNIMVFALLLFDATIIAHAMVEELDQIASEVCLLFCLAKINGRKGTAWWLLASFVIHFRTMMLPAGLAAAFVSLVARSNFTASSLLLNCLAIVIMAHFDDLLHKLLVPFKLQRKVTEAYMQEEADHSEVNRLASNMLGPVSWLSNRLTCVLLMVWVIASLYNLEWLLRFGGRLILGTNDSSCSDIMEAALLSLLVTPACRVLVSLRFPREFACPIRHACFSIISAYVLAPLCVLLVAGIMVVLVDIFAADL